MDIVGDVGRGATGAEIRVPPEDDNLTGSRDRSGGQFLFGENRQPDGIESQLAERSGMVFAAARIGVHALDQLLDRSACRRRRRAAVRAPAATSRSPITSRR